MSLLPCQSCQRHVRRDESECPFCGVTLELSSERRVPDVSHLSRAGRLAVGAALAALVALPGCGGGNPDSKAPDPGPDQNIAPPYGVPPDREEPPPPNGTESDAGSAETPQPPNDVPVAMYGAPAP